MPVLEVTCLRLKGLLASDPDLLQNLSQVRDKLQTNSQFYGCIEDTAFIYILGIWPSLDAHLEFLSSPAREEVLALQDDLLAFQWTVHMDLDQMSSLPLDAPVLAIERLAVAGNCVDAFNQAAMKHAGIVGGSQPFKITVGWRIDAAAGTHEALVFSGWQNEHEHVSFARRLIDVGDGDDTPIDDGRCEEVLVHHARNLERERVQQPRLA